MRLEVVRGMAIKGNLRMRPRKDGIGKGEAMDLGMKTRGVKMSLGKSENGCMGGGKVR